MTPFPSLFHQVCLSSMLIGEVGFSRAEIPTGVSFFLWVQKLVDNFFEILKLFLHHRISHFLKYCAATDFVQIDRPHNVVSNKYA